MGLLTTGGHPMKWGTAENEAARPHVLAHGIEQFLNIFSKYEKVEGSPFLWGDELEHNLVKVDPKNGTVLLALTAAEVLDRLVALNDAEVDWRPEYGSFMVESVPKEPFTLEPQSMCSIEKNQRRRYELLDKFTNDSNVIGTTLVTFPLMGVGRFSTAEELDSPHSQSIFVPDACINGTHPRFANLTANIRLRRGRKVCIQVPLFIDKFTLSRTVDRTLNIDLTPVNKKIDCAATPDDSHAPSKMAGFGSVDDVAPTPTTTLTHLYTPATDYYYAQYNADATQADRVKQRYQACPCPVPSVTHPCIYMDCMAFGMGCDCLQVTMQLANITEARHVYDQLAILCPPFLALSSATPFQKGLLADSDVRWLTIAASVDDRQRHEVPRIIKSRYDSISIFLGTSEPNVQQFSDHHVEKNAAAFERLTNAGVDEPLATHISHLFIRDPLVMYDQMIHIDDTIRNEHFENIQSTNWQTVRFKPPPLDNPHNIGWRVEFRVMDIQPTPFENSAFACVSILLVRAMLKFNARFYTKMTEVDRNMGKAHRRDPCQERYLWRRDVFAKTMTTSPDEFVELNANEIFNGGQGFIGLLPLVLRFIDAERDTNGVAIYDVPLIRQYIAFLQMKAEGSIPTVAQYWRQFVRTHPDYQHDSRLTASIARDIVLRSHDLSLSLLHDEVILPMSRIAARADTLATTVEPNRKRGRDE